MATIFMLLSMINQSIGSERIGGHLHTLLAYKIPLSRVILIKAIFIILITFIELIIMTGIYCWRFWGHVNLTFGFGSMFIFLLAAILSLVLFLISINILACYIFPKLNQVFSIISFGASFMILSFYKSLVSSLINYSTEFIIVCICLFGMLEYFLILTAKRIPNYITLKP